MLLLLRKIKANCEETHLFQVIPPFFMAGFGTLAAGLLLDEVQNWRVFQAIGELFVLVPALLGLKGNLAMTLASRLSTEVGPLCCNSPFV